MIKCFLILVLFFTISVFPQQGLIKTFYASGKVESEINYSNNIRNGEAKFYFENGNLEKTLTYVNGRVDGIVKEFYDNGKLKLSYTVVNGKKDGPVSFFKEDGSFINDITYEKGKRLSDTTPPLEELTKDSIATTSNTSASDTAIKIAENLKENNIAPVPTIATEVVISPDSVYSNVDVMPEPKGGFDGISKRLFWPGEALENKISGTVKIEAVIDAHGDVTDDKILQDIGYNCGESAKITVLYTKFKPGLLKGIPVRVKMIIPVEFKSN
jgi:TonB family protein